MPELPEVETIRRALENRTLHRRIAEFLVLREGYIRAGVECADSLKGLKIESIQRRGKLLAVCLSGGWSVLHHLGMSGRLLLTSAKAPIEKHTHLRIRLDQAGLELRQWDPRRFGYAAILRNDELDHYKPWIEMGADPFCLSLGALIKMLQNRKQPIKSFLLDQRRIAGLGNIYADEALFRAGIYPLRPAGEIEREKIKSLLRHIRNVLNESIAAGGSTTNDYQQLDGSLGEFQHQHRVYRKTGAPCLVCGAPIAKQIVGGRSTHYCPICQPLNK